MSRESQYLTESGSLRNATLAQIDLRKLIGYALDPDHEDGGHKALVFERVLGYDESNAEELRSRILAALPTVPARPGPITEHGARFRVELVIRGPSGREATVRTNWIYRPGETFPRLTTAFVRRRRKHAKTSAV